MARREPWTLNPAEVTWGTSGHTSTRRKKRRLSRQLDERSLEIKMTHLPTGIAVTGTVPEGHYSKREMLAAQNAVLEKLFVTLEAQVARHLKIPGR